MRKLGEKLRAEWLTDGWGIKPKVVKLPVGAEQGSLAEAWPVRPAFGHGEICSRSL
jgi:hypothetical protein